MDIINFVNVLNGTKTALGYCGGVYLSCLLSKSFESKHSKVPISISGSNSLDTATLSCAASSDAAFLFNTSRTSSMVDGKTRKHRKDGKNRKQNQTRDLINVYATRMNARRKECFLRPRFDMRIKFLRLQITARLSLSLLTVVAVVVQR